MKHFNFSHILFALWLTFDLTQTSIVLAQDCYGDYIDDVAAISVAFYHPSTSLNATFSVSATKKVIFAGGNLQYNAAQNQWRFAEHQYDVIGDAPGSGNLTGTKNNGVSCGGTISDRATQDKWIDLFQWGTSGYRNTGYEAKQTGKNYNVPASVCATHDCTQKYVYQPWDLDDRGNENPINAKYLLLCKGSLIDSSLVGTMTQSESDWAWHNPISNGGCEDSEFGMICYNSVHNWYVPSKAELQYIYKNRVNAHDLIAFATLMIGAFEKHGILLLPDAWDWDLPGLEGWDEKWVANTPFNDKGNIAERDATFVNEFKWSDNVLTEAEWNTFESYGAVFLPAAGAMQYGDWHWYDGWGKVNEYGEYWASNFVYSGDGKPQCSTIRFNTITGIDNNKKGAFYFGGALRSPLFSCAIRPVRVVE